MLDTSYKNGYYLYVKESFGGVFVSQAYIKDYNGYPALFVDGKPFPPMMATIYSRKDNEVIMKEEYYKNLGESGVKIFFLILVGMTVGFAAINTTLQLIGTLNISRTTWNIHFENPTKTGGVSATKEHIASGYSISNNSIILPSFSFFSLIVIKKLLICTVLIIHIRSFSVKYYSNYVSDKNLSITSCLNSGERLAKYAVKPVTLTTKSGYKFGFLCAFSSFSLSRIFMFISVPPSLK